jgi:spore maturation protein CgeB
MKILLTANKTYRGFIDTTWWYFFMPLEEMGHNVCFYDTVHGADKSYSEIIDSFKPDLIFCIMTGDANIAPKEPWTEILKETNSGRTKTFNWFCDDTWRFDNFSKIACKYFTVCSTPEYDAVLKYKNIGYSNIVEANWHANSSFYKPTEFGDRTIPISFIGGITPIRKHFFNCINHEVKNFSKISQNEMYEVHCNSRMGLNLSINDNDPLRKTQMKQRVFEITAAGATLFTQYHKGIERYFEIDKEILTFKTPDEFNKKLSFLLSRPQLVKSIGSKGHKRFLQEHDSKKRLHKLLEKIKNI